MSESHLLADILCRERLGLLHYARACDLYTAAADREVLAKLRARADAETDCLDAVERHLRARRAKLAPAGAFPSGFTILNFTTVRFVLPRVATDVGSAAQRLAADLPRLPEADRSVATDLLRAKEATLAALQAT